MEKKKKYLWYPKDSFLKKAVLKSGSINSMHLSKTDIGDANRINWFKVECNAGLLNQRC
jgi:hypothetical protein